MVTPLHWQKSSFSGGGDGNNCLELAAASGAIRLRESDEPGVELATGTAPLANLIRVLKAQHRDG
ncbi:DUF397 domain-containing protein [Streptomyces sp. NPDC050264]|uniref:DUF397 domain-containing protein n=1 Tax=Streptomyces sp. NPDC050264 TaxID=3155038 RepID=UPI003420CC71